MPEGVGYFGDDQHDKIVRQIDEQERYLLEQLTPRFQNVVRWMRLFLADRDDPRGPDEKWRANVFVPYPYSGVETRVAVLSDIFNSADPIIQAEAVGDEDLEGANKIERLLNYQLRRIKWRKRILNGLRMMAIQGTEFFKVRWVTKAHQITVYSDPSQIEDFTKAMLDAMVATGVQNREDVPDPTGDPEGFEVWRQMVNSSGQKVPEPPYSGKRWIKRYARPSVDRVPLFDLRFDPLVDELEEQPIVIHRMVKPLRWLLSQTGDRPDQPYDPVAVARTMEATKATNTQRLSDQDQRIAEIMGTPRSRRPTPSTGTRWRSWSATCPAGSGPSWWCSTGPASLTSGRARCRISMGWSRWYRSGTCSSPGSAWGSASYRSRRASTTS